MVMTLLEASKINSGDEVRSGVIEMFARTTPLMQALPFMDIGGGVYRYSQEGKLPGVGFRGINEAFQESTGILNPQAEFLRLAGGDMDVDKALVRWHGEEVRTTHEAMKIKASGLYIAKKVIKGDSIADPREFDGLQNRINGSQLFDAGSTDGGDALSLAKLDEAIDSVAEPNYLVMNKALRRRLTAAARNTSVGGFITHAVDQFGQRVTAYNDLPILEVDHDDEGALILDFNEVGTGGSTATATSLYVVSFGEGKLVGIQNSTMDVRDLGELQDKPVWRTRVDWDMGLAALHGKCAARVRGIKNVAVVA